MTQSTFLFATPNWAEGAGRLMDFGNALTQYNSSRTATEADMRALAMDWRAVGKDLGAAMLRVAKEIAASR